MLTAGGPCSILEDPQPTHQISKHMRVVLIYGREEGNDKGSTSSASRELLLAATRVPRKDLPSCARQLH